MDFMHKSAYKFEKFYAIIFFVVATVTGLVTSQWLLSFLLWMLVYIIWKWVELYYFYRWYKNGAQPNHLPQNHGIWEDFARLILHNRNKNRKIEKRNKLLLNQFNRTAQALPYATIILNKKHEINWVNPISYEILGVQQTDVGMKISNIVRDPLFIELLEHEKGTSDVKMTHPHDVQRKIHVKLVKLSSKRFLLVARDISQQDALRKSRKAFVDNASHELRTPLTVITGYLEMLQNARDMPAIWHPQIDQSLQQALRMEKIINDMLKLSTIEHERYMEDNHATIVMPNLLNSLLNDVKHAANAKRHKFSANIDSSLSIRGNSNEITSVVLNLLNNAVIHTPAGTHVSLMWYRQKQQAVLEISDTGAGIAAKHIPHLSERFYRVDNSADKNTNSTGLGLAIVKQICDNHHAELVILSEIKHGSRFKIIFPKSCIITHSDG